MVDKHPLEPFLPHGTRLLMLGSFPPQQKRWSMEFFYPNFNNDMWRIFGKIFRGDSQFFVDSENKCFRRDDIVKLLEEKGIGLYDTATEPIFRGSSPVLQINCPSLDRPSFTCGNTFKAETVPSSFNIRLRLGIISIPHTVRLRCHELKLSTTIIIRFFLPLTAYVLS